MQLGVGIKCAEYTVVSVLLASDMHTELQHLRRERERDRSSATSGLDLRAESARNVKSNKSAYSLSHKL